MISMGQPHRATPITGAVCLALACRIPGTLPHRLCASQEGPIRIAHPSGVTMVDAALDAAGEALYGAVYRTARRLFEGAVVYREWTLTETINAALDEIGDEEDENAQFVRAAARTVLKNTEW